MRNGQKRDFARGLRRDMTDAEHRLWHHLRNRRLLGYKFRRQVPIGRYVADFACLEAGSSSRSTAASMPSRRRTSIATGSLHECGFIVLRFWNNDVLMQTESVLEAILRAVTARCPHPGPLP